MDSQACIRMFPYMIFKVKAQARQEKLEYRFDVQQWRTAEVKNLFYAK